MTGWSWVTSHGDEIRHALWVNAELAVISVVIGLVISLPLGILCARFRWLYAPVSAIATILYAIPSLAFFIVLLDYTGLQDTTVIIPLALYTLSLLIPNIVEGINGVPDHVRQAAEAMGFGPVRRLLQVDLPVAVPVAIAGLRVAMVSSVSLVSVASLIGNDFAGLGALFSDGYMRQIGAETWTGIVLVVALALVLDLVIVAAGRLLTPWVRRPARRRLFVRREATAAAVTA